MALGRDRALSLDRPLLAIVLFGTGQAGGPSAAPAAQVRADGWCRHPRCPIRPDDPRAQARFFMTCYARKSTCYDMKIDLLCRISSPDLHDNR